MYSRKIVLIISALILLLAVVYIVLTISSQDKDEVTAPAKIPVVTNPDSNLPPNPPSIP